MGLTLKLWGATGTMTIELDSGTTTGPPDDRAYPVDPVGVASTRPSEE